MVKVNIFDKNFINDQPCSIYGKSGDMAHRSFTYVKNQMNWNGITIFTDHCYNKIPRVRSKVKIAWQVESPAFSDKYFYPMVKKYQNQLDYIFTYDTELIKSNPRKFKPVNFGGTTVHNIKFYPKTKDVCMIHSGKNHTSGHKLRHQVIDRFQTVDVYGKVTNSAFTHVENVYAPYRFAIIIENINAANYFSEKITDAIACGCIPIYHGCTNIDEYFDKTGILKFNTLDELEQILQGCNNQIYKDMFPHAKENMKTVKDNYWTNEDWLYNTYLKHIKL